MDPSLQDPYINNALNKLKSAKLLDKNKRDKDGSLRGKNAGVKYVSKNTHTRKFWKTSDTSC